MHARQLIFSGRVQGVGFRYSVKQIAAGFEIEGTVRNRDDGTVEVQAMAQDADEIDAFREEIENSHLASFIKGIDMAEIPPIEDVFGFSIVR
jgi:acylphosphatase